jgi:3-hydroxybutyryl-CoA dehydrogenase
VELERITIVGAGGMGSGIAQKFAMQGVAVDLVDLSTQILERSLEQIRRALRSLVEGDYLSQAEADKVLPRIRPSADLQSACNARFVLEAVNENLELKRQLFGRLDQLCPPETVLASNTSSLSISAIASAVARRGRVIGCHWLNPPYLVPLVEVVRGTETSAEVVQYCVGLLESAGFVPAVCKDVPGFVVNRLQWMLLNEILNLVERGIVNAEDADNIVSLGLGARLALYGPLKSNDLFADKTLTQHGFRYMFGETGDPRFKPSRLLEEKIAQGALGIKSGKGWYDYSGASFEDLKRSRDANLMKIIRFLRDEGFYPGQNC